MKATQIGKQVIKQFYFIPIILLVVVAVVYLQPDRMMQQSPMPPGEEAAKIIAVSEPIQPIPLRVELDAKKVQLGEKLFHETRLSQNNTISCATCHNLNAGGADRLPRSFGLNGTVASVNTPTVFNSALNFKQNWDGRFETLADQSEGAIKNVKDLGSDWPEVVGKLKQDPEYVKLFGQVYAEGITDYSIKDAIATFERSLLTPNSRFDKFLRGDRSALTEAEKEGYRIFKAYGCVSCHQGVNLGGNLFQKFGVLGDYFRDRGNITEADFGRFNVTGDERDRFVFKVPTLRNITLTPPYFHDGSAETLQQAIEVMAKYQLGRRLSPEQIDLIIKFLNTLTGEYQGKAL